MAKERALKVDGTHYRAVPELFMLDELDPLARFFLENVFDVERRIDYLLGIFGLPERTVEDILADLLKQNRISLRLETGAVEVLNRPPLRRRYRAGLPIDVWQDDSTGALLPLKLVAPYSKREDIEQIAHLKGVADDSTGFLDLADSRILAMLAPVDPGTRISAEGWVPETLRDKARMGYYPIYVPVAIASVNDLEVQFANAPGVPAWLTKLWSRELAEGGEVASQTLDETLAEAIVGNSSGPVRDRRIGGTTASEAEHHQGNLDRSDASMLLKRWANAIADLLDCDTDPRTLLNRLHQADLRLQAVDEGA